MKTDKCLMDLGQVKGEACEEAEPMAVLVMPWPKNCSECRFCDIELGEGYYCMAHSFQEVGWPYGYPDWCPAHKAIGIIEPNCHVVYLKEEEE